ncbi:MAG TPA: hypothetical protein VGS13_13875 [Stellaceae bacterium]|nr:hypothetical protein [Stellaceae bacterium]
MSYARMLALPFAAALLSTTAGLGVAATQVPSRSAVNVAVSSTQSIGARSLVRVAEVEHSEKPDRAERADSVDKLDKPDRPEHNSSSVDRVFRPERPDRPERFHR